LAAGAAAAATAGAAAGAAAAADAPEAAGAAAAGALAAPEAAGAAGAEAAAVSPEPALAAGCWAEIGSEDMANKAASSRETGVLITLLVSSLAQNPWILQCRFLPSGSRMTSPSGPRAPASPPREASPAAQAIAWLHTARFLTTAPRLEHLPALEVPEIAFVGRSNAGKSTCINTLTQQKRLAFASKTPGRTQAINLFALGKQGLTDAVLADLPGYGYAAVPMQDKKRWQQVMANYLVTRDTLTGVVMLCDARHGLTELDEILLEVIRPRVEQGLKFVVLLTKADKLNRSEANTAMSVTRLQTAGGELQLFSALKKQGVEEAALRLWNWAHPEAPPP
jgi:GTP-binding protein